METMENTEKKVYLVWYDNGLSYEDHYVHLSKVFSKEEDAQAFVKEKNKEENTYVPSLTKEEFYAKEADEFSCDYEQFLKNEEEYWTIYNQGTFYYSAEDLHESL